MMRVGYGHVRHIGRISSRSRVGCFLYSSGWWLVDDQLTRWGTVRWPEGPYRSKAAASRHLKPRRGAKKTFDKDMSPNDVTYRPTARPVLLHVLLFNRIEQKHRRDWLL